MKSDEVIYFDSFGVEYIPREIMKRIKDKNIKSNIFRIQDNNSIMCGYFCILFIEYMLDNKTLTDFTNLFSSWDFINLNIKMMETINLNTKYSPEDQSNYRLSEISKIKYYFNEEIKYQQSLTNKLNKYLTVLDILSKILTAFLTVFSSSNIFSDAKKKKKLLGLNTSIFSLIFS